MLPVQSLSCVQLFATLWTEVSQAIKSVMPSNYLILCLPLLLLPSIFPSIRVFSNESVVILAYEPSLGSLTSIYGLKLCLLPIYFYFYWSIVDLKYCVSFRCTIKFYIYIYISFPSDSVVKNPAANAGDMNSIPGLERSPGEGSGYPLQYSCQGNPVDRGA